MAARKEQAWSWARRLADPALALLVFGLSIQPLLADQDCRCATYSVWDYLLVALQCAPIAVRRRWPFSALLLSGIATSVYGTSALPDPPVNYAALVLMYNVAAHGTRRASHVSAFIAAVAIVVTFAWDWPSWDYQDLTVVLATFVTAYVLGDSVRTRRERTAAIEARAAQLEATRNAEAAAAVAAERNRIARELHDSVAHHVSLMVIQAEAGPVAVERQPDRAVDAFEAISSTGKHAMTEMRELLGVLKQDDATADRAPQPGLHDLADLVARTRTANVEVRLAVTGTERPLPTSIDLSAYRVLQEALTNCVRHAPGTSVDVTVHYGDHLVLDVVDRGPHGDLRGSPDQSSTGHGLISMRERVALTGGRLEVGRRGRGWRVHAELPIPPEPPV